MTICTHDIFFAEARSAPPTGDESYMSDSSSIVSYRLTPDMLSSDSDSEHEGTGDSDTGTSPNKEAPKGQEGRVDHSGRGETMPNSLDLGEIRTDLSGEGEHIGRPYLHTSVA